MPLSLGLGMLGVVVAAGLSPNAGVVRAASNCTYGNCVSSQPFPLWAVASSVAAVVVALLLALLLLRRRRRPGQSPSEWEGPGGGAAPPGASGPGGQGPYEGAAVGATAGALAAAGPGAESPPVWHEGPSETQAEPDVTSEGAPQGPPPPPEYLESPSVPEPEPSVAPLPEPAPLAPPIPSRPVVPAAAPPPPAAAPTAGEAEPDIDSLMAELEKISGEILKQKPKKKNGTPPSRASSDDSP